MTGNEPAGGAVPWYLRTATDAVAPPSTSPPPTSAPAPPADVPAEAPAPAAGAPAADGPAPAEPPPWAAQPAALAAAAATAPVPPSTGSGRGAGRRISPVLAGMVALVVAAVVALAVVVWPDSSGADPVADGGSGQTSGVDTDGDGQGGSAGGPSPLPPVDEPEVESPATDLSPVAIGDLGVGVPITPPACDRTWVVFIGSATDAATYRDEVSRLLATRSDAKYLLTQGGCTSMRQQMPDGSLIYAAYLGPYPNQADACAVRGQLGGGAYVKRMDNTTPADQLWQC